jgi:hypothetical protein
MVCSPRFTRSHRGVNVMPNNRVSRTFSLFVGVLSIAACASQPVSAPATALLERKFQIAARHYQSVQYKGQTVYCEKPATRTMPYKQCFTEAQLRREVESFERWRNPVQRPVIGTVSAIG